MAIDGGGEWPGGGFECRACQHRVPAFEYHDCPAWHGKAQPQPIRLSVAQIDAALARHGCVEFAVGHKRCGPCACLWPCDAYTALRELREALCELEVIYGAASKSTAVEVVTLLGELRVAVPHLTEISDGWRLRLEATQRELRDARKSKDRLALAITD